jgi:hypothetical protein
MASAHLPALIAALPLALAACAAVAASAILARPAKHFNGRRRTRAAETKLDKKATVF